MRLGQPLAQLTDLADEDAYVVSKGTQVAIRKCMNDRGLRFEPEVEEAPAPSVATLTQEVMAARQQDPETVVGYGFSEWNAVQTPPGPPDPGGLYTETEPAPRDGPNSWVNELSPEELARWRDAVLGDPSGPNQVSVGSGSSTVMFDSTACVYLGQEAIFGDMGEWYSGQIAARDAVDEARHRLENDPKVEEATGEWVACMAEAGFDYADLEAPLMDLAMRFPRGTEVSVSLPVEAEVAPVDVACFHEADLPEVLRSVQERVEADVLAIYEGQSLAYAEIQRASVQRARALE